MECRSKNQSPFYIEQPKIAEHSFHLAGVHRVKHTITDNYIILTVCIMFGIYTGIIIPLPSHQWHQRCPADGKIHHQSCSPSSVNRVHSLLPYTEIENTHAFVDNWESLASHTGLSSPISHHLVFRAQTASGQKIGYTFSFLYMGVLKYSVLLTKKYLAVFHSFRKNIY